ncbi:mycofactocin biosynthesis glycosyltransferase MftF [Gordonia sp. VNK21]|uniref:mycofactocin biosynthesis glycosyltransferase MftF n=1 Tax=Gordonia sp. VNK21 TaxID=3382483 RepID=UPI0038D4ACF7
MTGTVPQVPANTALPDGFQVQIDRQCVAGGDLRYLVGGSPMRILKLSREALGMTSYDGRIAVVDDRTRSLARTLLDAGIGLPRPMSGPTPDQVTVVVPVRDDQDGIDRLLPALHGLSVIVVDDGSAEPIRVTGDNARVLRMPCNLGPAAARNAGAEAAETEYVAFLDADTMPVGEWLTMLLGHFSDPTVAIVAPRIVGRQRVSGCSPVARYANACSSLDMGPDEAAVAPGSPLAYVPSAAMVVRRSAFAGFDESLRVAEDVDLCWRTHRLGWRVYYDPVAMVRHEHREQLGSMLGRRRFYGTGAAQLASRHGEAAAPVMSTSMVAATVIALLTRTRIGAAVAAVLAVVMGLRLRAKFSDVPGADLLAARTTVRAVGYGLAQAAAAMLRHYWPISVLLALVWPKFRRLVVELALAEGLYMWARRQVSQDRSPAMGPLDFLVLYRLDDLAYGTGLWQGALHSRSAGALRPVLKR